MRGVAGAPRRLPLRRDPLFWLLAIGTLAFYVRLLQAPGIDYRFWWFYLDEGYRLYPSLRLLRGESLFRDMFTAYPPLSYYLHLLAYWLLGVKVSSVRIVLIASQLATTTLAYALARHVMNRWFSLFAALLTVAYGVQWLNMGFTGWYVLPPLLGAMILLVRWTERGDAGRREPFLAGCLAGLAIAIKLRDGVWIAIGCALSILVLRILRDFEPGRGRPRIFNPLYAAHLLLPALVVWTLGAHVTADRALLFLAPNAALVLALLIRQTWGTSEIRPRVAALLADLAVLGGGVLVVTVPWVAYFLWAVGPDTLWSSLVRVPLAMSERMVHWSMSFTPFGAPISLAVALAGAGAALLAAAGPSRWRGAAAGVLCAAALLLPLVLWKDPMLWRTVLLAMLPVASGIALLEAGRHWRRPPPVSRAVLVLGIFNGTTIMTLFPWTDLSHWRWASAPAMVLIAFAASRLHRALARCVLPLRAGVVVVQCALLALWAAAALSALDTSRAVKLGRSASGDLPILRDDLMQTQQVVDFIERHVPAGGYVLEVPGSLYCFLSGRRQAARLDYFFVLDAGIWDEDREIEAIRRHDPTYALVRIDAQQWREAFPKVSAFVDDAFEPDGRVGRVEILKKRIVPGAAAPAHRGG